ncbi:MAG TPA: hypothetical protein VKI44_03615 [Acetobacteraceae bacterium]|nr:hypothetical protein [Acetobacteraceae bacterium]
MKQADWSVTYRDFIKRKQEHEARHPRRAKVGRWDGMEEMALARVARMQARFEASQAGIGQ